MLRADAGGGTAGDVWGSVPGRRDAAAGTALAADPDGALMARVARGDQGAFAELHDRVAPSVYGIARSVVRDPDLAEEIAQEVLLELWRTAPRFDASRGRVRAWAVTMAHRRAVDRVRSEQAGRDREARVATEPPTMPESSAEVLDALDRERVRRALDALTAVQREAVVLAYFGGHTYQEVARLLDCPEGTIKTRIRDGLIRLRDQLGVDP